LSLCFSSPLVSWLPPLCFYFASILDKQLGRYRQSHAFSYQILPRSLLLSVSLPLVFLLYACVHLLPYNLTIARLNRILMLPARPCLYISLYLIGAYLA